MNIESLPIFSKVNEIKDVALHNDIFLLIGETGSGKTTRLPIILKETMPEDYKIAITQPRRIATRSVSAYVAELMKCKLGEEVGYTIRFEDQTTEGTKMNFMTDGILLRKIEHDPLLSEYNFVMVDEVHERSLNIDFTMGLLKRLQQNRRETRLSPLKIAIVSATLEKEKLMRYFKGAPIIEIPGRMFPIEYHYNRHPVIDYPLASAECTKEIVKKGDKGNILIFVPGQEDIRDTISCIERMNLNNVVTLPLHSQLSSQEQDKIFDITETRRKVIVSTNIAETSVTVPDVNYVIDTGNIKQKEFDRRSGIESLVVVEHAKSGCIQRAGRAGRTSPGECFRLYSEENFKNRPEYQTPEILRSNLSHVVLMMKKHGIQDVKNFNFIDPPEPEDFNCALKSLTRLGALDNKENLTEIGDVMAQLPLEPHLARMVIEAQKYQCVQSICTISAFLEGKDVFIWPKDEEEYATQSHQKFKIQGSDFRTFLNIYKQFENYNFSEDWADNNYLNSKVLLEVKEVRQQLFDILELNKISLSNNESANSIDRSITAGLKDNLLKLNHHGEYKRVSDHSTGYFIHPSSILFHDKPKYLVAAKIVTTSKTYARTCQEVKDRWLNDK